jgi:hypothetical protein
MIRELRLPESLFWRETMKSRQKNSIPQGFESIFFLGVFLITLPVFAEDHPTRRPGLWEIKMTIDGESETMHQCVGENTDAQLLGQGQRMGKEYCKKNSMRKEGSVYVQESDCTFNSQRMLSKMSMKGDFQEEYQAEVHTSYEPPMEGTAESKTTIVGKHVGPCKANQNPGDTILADGMVIPLPAE